MSWRTRLQWSLAASASRHCAHDVSHHTEAESRGREPRPCAATARRADAAARLLQDKMQQELLLSHSPHSAQSAGVSLARCEDGCPRLSESRTQTWWSRSSNHLLAPRAIVLYFFKEKKNYLMYLKLTNSEWPRIRYDRCCRNNNICLSYFYHSPVISSVRWSSITPTSI